MAKRFFVLFLLISLYFSIPVSSALAYYTNMSADVVIGQPDFISNSSTTTQNSLSNPLGVFSDGTHLFVSDGNNNRVLIWNSIPTKNGTAADIVLGQPDFISSTANNGGISARTLNSAPYCVYSDGTHLVVCDQNNRRVLIWNSIPTTNQQAADVVVGQPDFVTSSAGTTASKFTFAIGALIYNGKLIVADTGNNRVLIFNSIPKTNGASADVVIGNTNFTSITSGTTASTFGVSNGTGPRGIVMIDGKLIVDDPGNRRVLIFNSLPTTNGVSADVVVGEPDFTTRTAEADLGISCARLNGNETVASAANGRLVIGDNHRVLIFNQIPTSNGASADIVLGQSDCVTKTANNGGLSASSLNGNIRPGVEVNNKLFVADSSNSRLLIFNNVISTPVIGLYPFPEAVGNGRLRMRGNVRLGEWERYILSNSKMEVSVNGGGYGAVSSLYGNREDTHDNLYEFFHEFDPSPIPGGTEGYTLKFHANSSNADESYAFYFTPFEIKSMTTGYFPLITFKVNKDRFSRVSDNLAEYEVQVKKVDQVAQEQQVEQGTNTWTTYLDEIPPSSNTTNNSLTTTYDQVNGIITVKSKVKSLASGKYQVKVVAVDDWGSRQETPSLTFSTTGGIISLVVRPSYPLYSGFFPLQVNGIRGVTSGIISTLLSLTQPSYSSSTFTPTLRGIAFANSTVTMTITNKYNSKQSKTYTTKVNPNSTYTLTPTLYQNSIIDMWVLDPQGRYNELPPFEVRVR